MIKLNREFKLPNRETWVKGKLRRASLQWPARNEALKRARKERGKYQCAMCEELFPVQKVQLDHILPVVNVKTGFTNWDDYILRLLPDVDGFSVLCIQCHSNKTSIEDHQRTFHNQNRKNQKS